MSGHGRRLRVGLVCPYSFEAPGGVQNHVLGLARHLRESGHRPALLAPGDAAAAEAAGLGSIFTSAGAAVPVRYNGSTARVNFGPLTAARVRRWMRDGGFDLVHVHEPVTPSIALLALQAADVPVVATFHTATPRSRSMQLARAVLGPLVAKVAAGIAVSETARDVVVHHLGGDPVVIGNGIRYDDFAVDGLDSSRPGVTRPVRIVYVGRDEPRKGLDVLLDALPSLRRELGAVQVLVVGRSGRALPADCISLGMLTEHEKAEVLRSADVFVAPHRARESFGIVVVEAMASGVPVVASALPAFRDLLSPPDAPALGELVPPGDPGALSAAVVQALREPDPGRRAKARAAAARFDWAVVGRRIVDVYGTAIGSGRAAPGAQPTGQWPALDAALVRRAQAALQTAGAPGTDPATALLLIDAAGAALAPGLDWQERERAENELSLVLGSVLPALAGHADELHAAHAAAELQRRVHNDAVGRRAGGRRPGRQNHRGHADARGAFETAAGAELVWPCDAEPAAGGRRRAGPGSRT